MSDIVEFLMGNVIKAFAPGGKLFVDLNGLLDHDLVRFLAPTDHGEIITGRNPFVAIGIESYP